MNLEDNEAYVICFQTDSDLGECYLNPRDIVVSKIRAAKFYGDWIHADSEFTRVKSEYKGCAFFDDESKISIRKVQFIIS
jgi:hypothetical protein